MKTSDVESRGLGGRDLDEVGFPSLQARPHSYFYVFQPTSSLKKLMSPLGTIFPYCTSMGSQASHHTTSMRNTPRRSLNKRKMFANS